MLKVLLIPALIGSVVTYNNGLGIKRANVLTSDYNPRSFSGGWDTDSSFVEEGVKTIAKGAETVGTASAWERRISYPGVDYNSENVENIFHSFDLSKNDTITFDFSVNYFDADGKSILSSQSSDALDLFALDAKTNSQISMIRIWTGSAGGKNGSHSVAYYGSGWGESYNVGYWIEGDASLDSYFHIEFSKELGFSPKFAGQEQNSVVTNADYIAKVKELTKETTIVKFELRGDNGWTKDITSLLRNVNGQSLASSEGNIDDNVGPTIEPYTFPASVTINTPVEIEANSHDVLSSSISYEVEYNGTKTEGKTFTPTKVGADSVTLYATDASGNTTSKTYNFEGVSNISAPEFVGDLPTINSGTYEYFTDLTINAPTINDATGKAVTTLFIKHVGAEEYTQVSLNSDNKYVISLGYDFVEGEYEYYFSSTNSEGTTDSSHQNATISLKKDNIADFIDLRGAKTVVEYVPEGLRYRAKQSAKFTTFGAYDLSKGVSIKFRIPYADYENGVLTPKYFELMLVNQRNPEYKIAYRIWLDSGKGGKDQPTNTYIYTPDGIKDITECGWMGIGDSTEYIETTFFFDMDTYFSSYNNAGAKTPAVGISNDVTTFFQAAPESNYYITFGCGSWAYGAGQEINELYEFTVTDFNGTSLANNSGVFETVNDALVEISGPEEVEVNKEKTYNIYAHDMFVKDENLSTKFTMITPSGNETINVDEFGDFKYTFTEIGKYTIKAEVTGKNERTVTKQLEINATQEKIPTIITLKGEYPETVKVGEEVVVIGATYSSNVNPEKCTITVIDMNGKAILNTSEGSKLTFKKPGLYTIRYYAADDALPVNNEATLDVKINVIDDKKPVIDFTINETYTLGETVTFTVKATDDSDLTYSIIVTKPDGTTSKFSKATFEFTFETAGEYKFDVKVTDLYDNYSTLSLTTRVNAPASSGCGGSIVATSIFISTLALGIGTLGIAYSAKSRKNKNEK